MAERRMFSKAVVNSARFLRMPQTSRLLYYDLGMAADDDGVVEAFTVLRTTGAAEDDLRVLAAKGFITILNDDLVAYIKDWTLNNQLRRDRYHKSVYAELLVKLADGNQPATIWQPDGNQLATESSIGKFSQVEVSLVEDRGEGTAQPPTPTRKKFDPPSLEEVTEYVRERGSRVDPQGFIDFYASKGWMVGRSPMKDWKAACRRAESWERWSRPQQDDKDRLRTDADYSDGESFV